MEEVGWSYSWCLWLYCRWRGILFVCVSVLWGFWLAALCSGMPGVPHHMQCLLAAFLRHHCSLLQACIERDCYPSPLNYFRYPKSCCTWVQTCLRSVGFTCQCWIRELFGRWEWPLSPVPHPLMHPCIWMSSFYHQCHHWCCHCHHHPNTIATTIILVCNGM